MTRIIDSTNKNGHLKLWAQYEILEKVNWSYLELIVNFLNLQSVYLIYKNENNTCYMLKSIFIDKKWFFPAVLH